MKKTLNILIIEDHPMVIEVYKKTLIDISKNNTALKFNITSAVCCESANFRIDEHANHNPLHLVLLDLSLPASKDGKLMSGDDLGHK
ncbi:MAG: DNA-binding response regulator, partial [Gelidibacter sp.]